MTEPPIKVDEDGLVRLQKLLAASGVGSRRTIRLRPSWMTSSTMDRPPSLETTLAALTCTGPSSRVTPSRSRRRVPRATTPSTSAT